MPHQPIITPQVGMRLRFTQCPSGEPDHGRLQRGDVLVVNRLNSYNRSAFTASMPEVRSRRGYSTTWWFNVRYFEPATPPTPEELQARTLRRREIECPKVNLP